MTITPSKILAARSVPQVEGQIDMSDTDAEQCPCTYAPGAWCDIHHGDNPICDCPRAPRAWCPVCQDCAACDGCDHIGTDGNPRD